MPLMTRRQYAAHRGVSESAVGKYVRSGVLAGAMNRAGKIDAFVADELLAAALANSPSNTNPALAAAKRRKLAASVALLQAKVTALETTVVPRDEAGGSLRIISLNTAKLFYDAAPALAVAAAGQEPLVAFTILTDGIHAAMNQLASVEVVAEKPDTKTRTPKLATMSAVKLRTLENDLHAKRYEIEQARSAGVLLDVEAVLGTEVGYRLQAMRQHLLAIPTKLAPRMIALPPGAARTAIVDAMADALAELACWSVSEAELRNAA